MKKFLVLSMVAFQAMVSAQNLESLRLTVVKKEFVTAAKKAFKLGNGTSQNYTVYSGKFENLDQGNVVSKIHDLLGDTYTGYSAPVRGVGISAVDKNLLDVHDAIDFSLRSVPKQNGAKEVLEDMKLSLIEVALKDGSELGLSTISSEGAWHACKELAWIDYASQEILVTGSCWSE
jgi:hypothetical protein